MLPHMTLLCVTPSYFLLCDTVWASATAETAAMTMIGQMMALLLGHLNFKDPLKSQL